jgi:hypothetical protein
MEQDGSRREGLWRNHEVQEQWGGREYACDAEASLDFALVRVYTSLMRQAWGRYRGSPVYTCWRVLRGERK